MIMKDMKSQELYEDIVNFITPENGKGCFY